MRIRVRIVIFNLELFIIRGFIVRSKMFLYIQVFKKNYLYISEILFMLIKFKKMKDINIIKRKFCNNFSQLLKNVIFRCWFIEIDLIEIIGIMYFNN